MADAYVPTHAVTYEMTGDGPRIAADQVVTAEADTRPAAQSEPAVARSVPRQIAGLDRVMPDRPPPTVSPGAEKGE